ncbi:MAG: hypothetical protein LBB36_01665 [Fibromonadaceae bacterium]|nr:hypothetical protein [Fibromonadaceae bacterium]
MPKFLLILFILAVFIHGAETSLSRYSRPEHGVLAKEYDMEGGRAYWLNGISILGLPDAGADIMGISDPARRLPLGLAGIYTPPPIYERYGLSLNASNGRLVFRENYNPVDTPVTALLWERYGLEGNAFRLDFNRQLLDSIVFSLGLVSHSVSKSNTFYYQDIVQQLYTGTMKRDSTGVPLTGRNLMYNSFHIVPAITWFFPHSSITAQMSYLFFDNDDATRDLFEKSITGTSIEFPQDPYNIKGNANFYRLLWNYNFLPGYNLSLSHRLASQELRYSKLDTASIYFPEEVTESYTAQTGEGRISHKSFFNPYIKFNYEYLRSKEYLPKWIREEEDEDIEPPSQDKPKPLYQDRQLLLLGIKDTVWRFSFRGESGLQRNASAFDSVDFAPALHIGATLFLPWHLQLSSDYQKDTRFPDFHETHILRIGRISFPNEKLREEKRQRWETSLMYKLNEYFFYAVGFRYEKIEYPIVPNWQTHLDEHPADSAFQWVNAVVSWNYERFWLLGFELGNWRFYAEHGKTFDRNGMMNIPTRYYKGAVHWSNRFVEDRLKVTVQFDADWFGDRWDYGLKNDSIAAPVELRKYLSLNFKSSMQIQDFILYARIENMNHSLMEPEVGYAPPGIRFAYGIEWMLTD